MILKGFLSFPIAIVMVVDGDSGVGLFFLSFTFHSNEEESKKIDKRSTKVYE